MACATGRTALEGVRGENLHIGGETLRVGLRRGRSGEQGCEKETFHARALVGSTIAGATGTGAA